MCKGPSVCVEPLEALLNTPISVGKMTKMWLCVYVYVYEAPLCVNPPLYRHYMLPLYVQNP